MASLLIEHWLLGYKYLLITRYYQIINWTTPDPMPIYNPRIIFFYFCKFSFLSQYDPEAPSTFASKSIKLDSKINIGDVQIHNHNQPIP